MLSWVGPIGASAASAARTSGFASAHEPGEASASAGVEVSIEASIGAAPPAPWVDPVAPPASYDVPPDVSEVAMVLRVPPLAPLLDDGLSAPAGRELSYAVHPALSA